MISTMVSYDIPYVLEPDTCLPAQVAALHTSGQLSGELRLLHAILVDALHCLKRHTTLREKREYRDALEWVNEHDIDHPMSFESICIAMHLHAGAVRAEIACDSFRVGGTKMRCHTVDRVRGYRMRESVRP
jgi:hypothetical protein